MALPDILAPPLTAAPPQIAVPDVRDLGLLDAALANRIDRAARNVETLGRLGVDPTFWRDDIRRCEAVRLKLKWTGDL